jgi:hypothetical protein
VIVKHLPPLIGGDTFMGTMNLPDLISVCSSEESAFQYLFTRKKELTGIYCPYCHHDQFYRMSLRRLRCNRCKRDYRPFYRTPLVTMRIPYTFWLLFLKEDTERVYGRGNTGTR